MPNIHIHLNFIKDDLYNLERINESNILKYRILHFLKKLFTRFLIFCWLKFKV